MNLSVDCNCDHETRLLPHLRSIAMPQSRNHVEGALLRTPDKYSAIQAKWLLGPLRAMQQTMEHVNDSNHVGVTDCELSNARIKLPPSDQSASESGCSCTSLRQFLSAGKACPNHRSLKSHYDRHHRCHHLSHTTNRSCSLVRRSRCDNRMQMSTTWLFGSRPLSVTLVCLSFFVTAFYIDSVSSLPSYHDILINNYETNAINDNNGAENNIKTNSVNNRDHRTHALKSSLDEEHWDANHEESDEENWSQKSFVVTPDPHSNDTKFVCRTDVCIDASRYLLNSLDMDANPCDDFYKFACGSYLKDHPIPLHVKSWNHFVKVFYEIRDKIKEKLNKNKADFQIATHNKTVFNKLHDFFHGCLDKDQRNITGYSSLFSLIGDIGGWPMINNHWNESTFHWEKTYVRLTKLDMFFFLRIEPMTDLMNTSKTIIKIGPPYKIKENIVEFGSVKVPYQTDKYAYSFVGHKENLVPATTETPKKKMDANLVKKYMQIIKELKDHSEFAPSNVKSDYKFWDEQLEKIYILQTDLENSAQPILPMENYQSNYDSYLYSMNQIQQLLGLDLALIVKEMFGEKVAANSEQKFFVPDIKYLKRAGEFLKQTDKKVLANYLVTNMVMSIASHTTPKMISLLVTDSQDSDIMPNICYEETSRYLPELLGKFFLDNIAKLSPNWRKEVYLVVKLLRESFSELLKDSKWMDDSTIEMAIKKLDHMSMHIGSPDWYSNDKQFEQYSAMFDKIDRDNYFRSVMDVTEIGQQLEMQELSERLHTRTSSAQLISWPGHRKIIDVNAFYYFTTNGVYIPAAILQPPFFYQEGVPKAVTFGSMGMIIGHEMTHAFDNSGRLYNFEGALQKWWSNATLESFQNKTDCFVKQYSNYKEESIGIDGVETLAENIADNGGLRRAFQSFKHYQNQNKEIGQQRLPVNLSRFTPDQLFFISFATMWCGRLDPSELNVKNSHSPPSIRVLGSLANFDQFSKAFNCPVNSKMNPVDKCILW